MITHRSIEFHNGITVYPPGPYLALMPGLLVGLTPQLLLQAGKSGVVQVIRPVPLECRQFHEHCFHGAIIRKLRIYATCVCPYAPSYTANPCSYSTRQTRSVPFPFSR